jgi:hypothetical protein
MVQAESVAAAGQKPEAAAIISRATSLWTAAERAKVPATAPQSLPGAPTVLHPLPATRPTDGSSGRTETYAQPPLPDSAQIVEFYGDLERAIESKQLGEVRRLLPNLSDTDERDWRGLFEDDGIRQISASFQVQNVTRGEGLTAFARVFSDIRVTKSNGKVETRQKGWEYATLTLGPQGWRQIRSERIKS